MPIPTAKIIAARVSSIVAGKRSPISVVTGAVAVIDWPKSRRTTDPM